jgi:7,8-dihydroneopterin aldolase/epimerase/oxygenase
MSESVNQCILQIHTIRLWLHIGCSLEEQKNPQAIDLDLALSFNALPPGALNDSLQDTACYDSLSTVLIKEAEQQRVHLIEHLAYHFHCCLSLYIHQNMSKLAASITSLSLTITKKYPPCPSVYGGVSFHYKAPLNTV